MSKKWIKTDINRIHENLKSLTFNIFSIKERFQLKLIGSYNTKEVT